MGGHVVRKLQGVVPSRQQVIERQVVCVRLIGMHSGKPRQHGNISSFPRKPYCVGLLFCSKAGALCFAH
jgi:hypothetical protein